MFFARGMLRPVFISALLAAACASPAAAAGDILAAPQLAARVNGGEFEFRGRAGVGSGAYLENHIWRFSADAKVTDVGTIGRLWYFGGYNEQPLPASSGTWRLAGSQICIEWQPNNQRFNGCYDVLNMSGGQVSLVGPQILSGTMQPDAERGPVAVVPAPRRR
jgi:hypothetical protein